MISRAKFHCSRLTIAQDIQDYASLIFGETQCILGHGARFAMPDTACCTRVLKICGYNCSMPSAVITSSRVSMGCWCCCHKVMHSGRSSVDFSVFHPPRNWPPRQPITGIHFVHFNILVVKISRHQLLLSLLVCVAADNPSTLSCMVHRAGPTAWKPRSALSEGFFLALWPGSIRIRSAGGIFGFPRLVVLPRYSRGGRRGCRLPSPGQLKACKAKSGAELGFLWERLSFPSNVQSRALDAIWFSWILWNNLH